MIRNALASALIVYLAILGVVLKECVFLAPYRLLLWNEYAVAAAWWSLLLIMNLFAALYSVFRKLALKDTGDKLTHLEKQLRGRTTMSGELTERILERK
jgi:di/tricarboxylate transporter